MNIGKLGEIKAIAFDIDGTLYRNSNLYSKLVLHYLRNLKIFKTFNSVRKEMHAYTEPLADFRKVQSQKMAEKLHCSETEAEQLVDKVAYGGLEETFRRVKPCKGTMELFQAIKANNLKIGILSDFPPEQKGELWGLKPYCDVILGTEELGLLKPSPYSFQILAQKLGVKPEEILYVGNSETYDVGGSKNAGMKAAWFAPVLSGILGKRSEKAEITFWSYRKLKKQIFR